MGSKNACALEFACILVRNIKCSIIITIIIISYRVRARVVDGAIATDGLGRDNENDSTPAGAVNVKSHGASETKPAGGSNISRLNCVERSPRRRVTCGISPEEPDTTTDSSPPTGVEFFATADVETTVLRRLG